MQRGTPASTGTGGPRGGMPWWSPSSLGHGAGMLCPLGLPMFHTVIPSSACRFLMAWKPSAVRISGGAPTLTYSAPICFRSSNCSSVGVALDCAHSLIPGAVGRTAALVFRGARSSPSAILPISLRPGRPGWNVSSPLLGKPVKLIADSPLHFLPRLRVEIDEGFGTNRSADGPEKQLRNGPVGCLPHADSRFPVLNSDIVIAWRVAEALHRGGHRLANLQLLQVRKILASRFRHPMQVGLRMDLERKTHDVTWACGPVVQHVEIVLVNAGRDRLLAGIPQAVLQHHLRLTRHQPNGLLIDVSVPEGIGEFLRELHEAGGLVDGPFPVVRDVVGAKLAEGGLLGSTNRADPDFHEALAWFRFLVAQAHAVREELLHRPRDGIANLRVVLVESFAEIFVTLKLKTRNGARPVKPRAAVVAVVGVRQQQLYLQNVV